MSRNTYINENLNSRYPFRTGVFLPFPDRLITDLKVCVLPDCAAVYISSVQVTASAVRVTVCARIDDTEKLLGYIQGGQNPGVESIDSDRPLNGFLVVGQLQYGDAGTYNGTFHLDPSCVLCLPTAVHHRYTGMSINGHQLDGKRKLEINVIGLFRATQTSSVAQISLTDEAKNAHFIQADNEYAYTRVNTVNDCKGTILNIVTGGGITADATEHEHVYPTVVYSGGSISSGGVSSGGITAVTIGGVSSGGITAVTITLNGTSKFPHCYGEADESGGC